MPVDLRKKLKTDLTKQGINELAIWDLADDGWRDVLRDRADKLTGGDDRTLNTPNSEQLRLFFLSQIGLPDITDTWYWRMNPRDKVKGCLDDFVTLRCAIAHRRSPTAVVLKKDATDGLDLVKRLAAKSAQDVSSFLKDHTGQGLPPSTP